MQFGNAEQIFPVFFGVWIVLGLFSIGFFFLKQERTAQTQGLASFRYSYWHFDAGCFWSTPKGTRQGPHEALTDIELITIRLGAMGNFETAKTT